MDPEQHSTSEPNSESGPAPEPRGEHETPAAPPQAPSAPIAAAPPARRRRLRGALIAFLFLILAGLAAAGGAYRYLENWAETPQGPRPAGAAAPDAAAPGPAPAVTLTIPKGSSIARISELLAGVELIDDARLFQALALRDRGRGSLQAGRYLLRPPLSPRQLMTKLRKGSFQRKITIPEGWTARQIDAELTKQGLIASGQWVDLAASPPAEPPAGEPLPQGIEGFCFPDTYFLEDGETHAALADRMLRRFAKVWGELEPARRDPRSENLTAREVVALASIIQREARRNDELPRMASVFLNRLKIGMKLQSCATVHYALGEVWWRELTRKDLTLDSPYNTYKNAGLPPGPISNPGREAIEAVLRPAATDDLFFVYRGNGTHEFTKTYKDHVKATKRFRAADPQAELQTPDGEGAVDGAPSAAAQPEAAAPKPESASETAAAPAAPPAPPTKKKPRRR